jgi:hypothetical protein
MGRLRSETRLLTNGQHSSYQKQGQNPKDLFGGLTGDFVAKLDHYLDHVNCALTLVHPPQNLSGIALWDIHHGGL